MLGFDHLGGGGGGVFPTGLFGLQGETAVFLRLSVFGGVGLAVRGVSMPLWFCWGGLGVWGDAPLNVLRGLSVSTKSDSGLDMTVSVDDGGSLGLGFAKGYLKIE